MFLVAVETHLIGEMQSVGHDVNAALVVAGDVPVIQVRDQRVDPVLDLGGDGDPEPVLGIAEDEIDLADRRAVDGVEAALEALGG